MFSTAAVRNDGLVAEQPFKLRFGLLKVSSVTFAGLLIGGLLAKSGAEFLEENEIFAHEHDED
ncbi:unnamed protein product [Soboliphyme baturini]|uniref:Essential MCU regulator, mitochondrial n=1 Tax=Soboliphyme baturini TaxID=241478 RepID=A0A183IH65_9BILA|nr:unnamed protein product [Soboliphyme baturini]